MRPLGIASYEDKIVQLAVKKVLEAIYEPRFLNSMYGFRPNRGCHEAVKEVFQRISYGKISYIVDADIKLRLEHYQKFYQNGTYERSKESGTEANYDMVDGLVNNQKKNPEKISNARSNKQTPRNQQDGKPKKRRSVIKRLHQKQIAIARRSGKPIPKYLDQEMERKRG